MSILYVKRGSGRETRRERRGWGTRRGERRRGTRGEQRRGVRRDEARGEERREASGREARRTAARDEMHAEKRRVQKRAREKASEREEAVRKENSARWCPLYRAAQAPSWRIERATHTELSHSGGRLSLRCENIRLHTRLTAAYIWVYSTPTVLLHEREQGFLTSNLLINFMLHARTNFIINSNTNFIQDFFSNFYE